MWRPAWKTSTHGSTRVCMFCLPSLVYHILRLFLNCLLSTLPSTGLCPQSNGFPRLRAASTSPSGSSGRGDAYNTYNGYNPNHITPSCTSARHVLGSRKTQLAPGCCQGEGEGGRGRGEGDQLLALWPRISHSRLHPDCSLMSLFEVK